MQARRQYVAYVARGHVVLTIDSEAVHAEMVEAQDEETRTTLDENKVSRRVSNRLMHVVVPSSVQVLLMERDSRIKIPVRVLELDTLLD
jgi:hypothetical protein